jgi:hypothetical protein
MFWCWRKT